tara:strand:+ start:263 stop:568 length:306 start_codon:yes stop_codon:yes gene_type:complete
MSNYPDGMTKRDWESIDGIEHHYLCHQHEDYVAFCVRKQDGLWYDNYGEGDLCDEIHDICDLCGDLDNACRCECSCDDIYDSIEADHADAKRDARNAGDYY